MSINNLNTYLNIRDAHLRVVSGNVYAQAMNIGGINVETAHGLQSVSNTGNATSLTLEFANVTTGFVTTANAQIGRDLVVTGNATISKELTVTSNAIVSSNLNVSDDLVVTNNILASNNLTVTGNLNVTTVMSDSNVVIEYTGPHDRPLRKYPEVALTANDNSSTSGYVVDQTNTASHGNADAYAYRLFDSLTTGYQSAAVYSGGDSTSSAQTTTATDGSTHQGVAITLDLATKIRLSYAKITSHTYYGRTPVEGTFLGSNNNSTWDVIGTFSGLSTTAAGQTHTVHIADYATKSAYRYIRLVVTKIHTSAVQNGGTLLEFRELEYYGYEEGSGSLDTTLKSVYNVPATTGTQLEVYYDGRDYSADTDFDQINEVLDKSGNNLHGSQNGGVGFDPTYKAFTFDGADDKITTTSIGNTAGDWTHSTSFWFKFDVVETVHFYSIGPNTSSGQNVTALYYDTSGFLQTSVSGGVYTRCENVFLLPNHWYHLTTVKRANAQDSIYLNGIELPVTEYGNTGLQMSLPANTSLNIGARPDQPSVAFFDGSIANFRLYSKALNADQVKELYDYQKDYFLGSKSQVTLYKGHLGVGVTEPSGQLELAGDERIQEYPPGPMSDYDTYIPGHGVFCASAINESTNSNDPFAWKAFNKETSGSKWWFEHNSSLNGVEYQYGTASDTSQYANPAVLPSTNGVVGLWIELKMPYAINLKKYALTARADSALLGRRMPEEGVLFGSNDDGTTWTAIHNHKDTGGNYEGDIGPRHFNVDDTSKSTYSCFRFVTTKLFDRSGGTGTSGETPNIGEIQFFGTPGPTTLDKGSLTLGRSLDVPRISRYDVDTETPRPEKLLVDFDTTVNSSPTDISGRGNHGTFYSGAYYSAADKAFDFPNDVNTVGQIVKINTVSPISVNTDIDISFSVWVKVDTASTTGWRAIWEMGSRGANAHFGLYIPGSTAATNRGPNQFSFETWGQGYYPAGDIVEANRWYHVVGTYDKYTRTKALYVDGVYKNSGTITTGAYSSGPANPPLTIGAHLSGGEGWVGQVSNFKVYKDAILEPSEVRKLYNLGRTGRSMIISDTAVGIGKAPEAQLDVRGNLNVDGVITNQQRPAFYVWRDGTGDNVEAIGHGGGSRLAVTGVITNWDSKRIDTAGTFDLSNGRYYIPVSGLYMFIGAGVYRYQSGNAILEASFYVNGSNVGPRGMSYNRGNTTNEHHTVTITFMRFMNAGDYVQMGVPVAQSACDLYYGDNLGYFSGYLLG